MTVAFDLEARIAGLVCDRCGAELLVGVRDVPPDEDGESFALIPFAVAGLFPPAGWAPFERGVGHLCADCRGDRL